MQPNIRLKTKGQNNYLYNYHVNRFHLTHPVMDYLLKLHEKGTNIEEWFARLPDEGIAIEDCDTFGKEEIRYYYQKFLLFSENGFFPEVKIAERLAGRVTKEQVFSLLSNVTDVVFEVTDSCNLKCKYCAFGDYYENYDKRERKELSITKAKNLLDYLSAFWQSPLNTSHKINVNIGFYGGEPLLNMDLIKKVVSYAKKIASPRNSFIFRMTTNALLLEKYMDYLVENDFGLLISLDGNKDHNGYRVFPDGSEAYDVIFRNIKALQNKYPVFFKKKAMFNVVLHNKNNISEVYDYFRENFDTIPTISELSPIGIRHDKKKEFLEMYLNAYESLNLVKDYLALEKEIFQKLPNIKSLCNVINHCSGHCFMDYRDLIHDTRSQERIPTGTCLPFSRKIFLSVNGKVFPCERIGHQYDLGTVDEERVTIDAERVARQINNYFDKIRSHCIDCFKAEICSMCVFNLKLDKEGEVNDCPEFMEKDNLSRYFSIWLSKLEENPGYYSKIMNEVYMA